VIYYKIPSFYKRFLFDIDILKNQYKKEDLKSKGLIKNPG